MFLSYIIPRENITIPSEAEILFNDLSMRPLWNMLYKAQVVLSKEWTQSVPNFTSFLKWLKNSISKKEHVSFLSIVAQVPKYIGISTAWTFYAISQHKLTVVIDTV